jgi:hypothetical protein
MTRTTHVARAFAFASVSLRVPFECAKAAILERAWRIDGREPGRVLAASFHIELEVEAFRGKIAFFVDDPIVEPAVRLNDEFRHIFPANLMRGNLQE